MEIGVLFAILAMVTWGMSDFFIGYSAKKVSTVIVLLYGKIIGFLILSSLVILSGLVIPTSLDIWGVVILTSLIATVAWFLFSQGLKEGFVSILSPIGNSWAAITVLLGIIFLGQSFSFEKGVALVIIFVGIFLTAINIQEIKNKKGFALLKGVPITLVSMVLWGIFFIFVDIGVRNTSWISFFFFMEIFSIIFLFTYSKFVKPDSFSKAPEGIVGFGIANSIGLGAYGFALATIPTTIAASIVSGLPVIALILAHIFLKEKLRVLQYFGIALTIVGLILISV